MKLELIFENFSEKYIYLERYVNNGSPSGFSFNTTSEYTAPLGTNEFYYLSVIEFDDTIEVKTIGDNNLYPLSEKAIICHPDNVKMDFLKNISEHWRETGKIKVSPTASGRTVKCIGENEFFIKLDYHGLIGRITRNLDSKKLYSACEVSEELINAINNNKMNNKFFLFKENCGKVAYIPLGDGQFYELGFVYREHTPYPYNNKIKAYLPFFSLFGTDRFALDDLPIIVQLYNKSSQDPNEFLQNILTDVINCYFDSLENCGMCLEAHAQNMLIGIDENFNIQGIIARDMESVDKDLPLREYLNLDNNFKSYPYKCLKLTDYNYQIMHSFMFDFKLGIYLIDPLIDTFNKYIPINVEQIIYRLKEVSKSRIKNLPNNYFPNYWYNYDNKIFDRSKPRPYIAHDNPRYR